MVRFLLCLFTSMAISCTPSKSDVQQTDPEVRRSSAMSSNQPSDNDQIERIAVEYLTTQKKWQRQQYRLEHKGRTTAGYAIVWAVYLEDEKLPPMQAGGGDSVVLHVDQAGNKVVRELGFQ
jgi:hypothetical protein